MSSSAPGSLASGPGLTAALGAAESKVPEPARSVLRGVGQVFFQENALSGACFVLGIAAGSPALALATLTGAVLGTATARLARFDAGETAAGLYGFNATLVGLASLFFFQFGPALGVLMVVGCVAATFLTRLARTAVPFPTYTGPFIVVTWALVLVGRALGLATHPGGPPLVPNPPLPLALEAAAHGVGQVMFQASLWAGLLFLAGIALGCTRHALLVLAGAVVGMLLAGHHATEAYRALDPERLIERSLYDNIGLGLYGYNSALAAVALYLWRRSLIPVGLGMLLAVPLTELLPLSGLPALTAPFVLATWLVQLLGWFDSVYLRPEPGSPPA